MTGEISKETDILTWSALTNPQAREIILEKAEKYGFEVEVLDGRKGLAQQFIDYPDLAERISEEMPILVVER